MSRLTALTYALAVGAMVLAWAVAIQRHKHRTIALLLSLGLVVDLARRGIYVAALKPGYALAAGGPLTGWHRVAGNLDMALFLLAPAGLAAAALYLFGGRRPWAVALAWGLAVVVLATTYPLTRGAVLARAYLGIQLVSLFTAIACAATWIRHPRRASPELQHVALALMIATEASLVLVGPWKRDLFGSWQLAEVGYATLYGTLAVLYGGYGTFAALQRAAR